MMRNLLFLVTTLFLFGCTTTETVQQPCPSPRVPQCPFGQPVIFNVTKSNEEGSHIGVVVRDHYSLGYSYRFENALWACETMSKPELTGNAERKGSFSLDPQLSKFDQAKSSDYTNSGYDRAHLIAAANHLWNQSYVDQTFYMTNVVPMRPSFNRGIWRQFEQWVRSWVSTHEDAYVISGAIFSPNVGRLYLREGVDTAVPSHFYKVLVSKRGTKSWHAIAFLFDHEEDLAPPYNWKDFVVSIDYLEAMAYLDLMPSLSRTDRERIESKAASFDLWK